MAKEINLFYDTRIGIGPLPVPATDVAIALSARELAGDGEAEQLAVVAAMEHIGLVEVGIDKLGLEDAGIVAERVEAC